MRGDGPLSGREGFTQLEPVKRPRGHKSLKGPDGLYKDKKLADGVRVIGKLQTGLVASV